ncbi:hypothetical protein YB2330_000132 [Saitoella coloradoensis]
MATSNNHVAVAQQISTVFPKARQPTVGKAIDEQQDGLFAPLKIKDVELKNRVMIPPMCMYSAVDGVPNTFHLGHYTGIATRGAGLIIAEASGVSAEGRITPSCCGIWNEEQEKAWKGIVDAVHAIGDAKVGLQIAHAGRKASTYELFEPVVNGTSTVPRSEGGWAEGPNEVISSTNKKFQDDYPEPIAMQQKDIDRIVKAFADAAVRADRAGFDVVEIHMAHGYLAHQFYSPLSNDRTDAYGGSFEGRVRFPLEVAKAVRAVWPENKPLFARLSCSDWVEEGGWTIEDSVKLSELLMKEGVDLIDCSSGGASPDQKIKSAFNAYQVPFSKQIRDEVKGIKTAAVGGITNAEDADSYVRDGSADLVAIGRGILGMPNWVLDAAKELKVTVPTAPQYVYGAGGKSKRRLAKEAREAEAKKLEDNHGAVQEVTA